MANDEDKQSIDPDTQAMLEEAGATEDTETSETAETASAETVENEPAETSEEPNGTEAKPDDQGTAVTEIPTAAAEPVAEGTKPKWYRNKVLLALLGVLLLAAAGLGYYFVFGDSATETSEAPTEQSQTINVPRFGVAVGLVEGTAEFSKDGNTWTPLDTAANLVESDHVRTGEASRAVLLIDDGSALRLNADTHVQLISLATDDVRISNESGDVYSRVVPSDDRRYAVYVAGDLYEARGTAYRAVNTEDKKGVEVFHSTVVALDEEDASGDVEVTEGNAFFTANPEKEKEKVLSAIDLEKLKDDEFIKWCAEQDKQNEEFADQLGVLVDIDKPKAEEEKPVYTAPKQQSPGGISLKAQQVSDYKVLFTWSVSGVDTSQGFKLVRSAKTTEPTYPDNSVVFIEAGQSSYELHDDDGGTYNYRLCAYRGDSCGSYSNTVSASTKREEKVLPEAGAVTLSKDGTKLSWTYAGTAPYGFKLVVGKTTGPTYESNYKKIGLGETEYKLVDIEGLESGKTYYIRVCKYIDGGGCQDYSNEVTYAKP